MKTILIVEDDISILRGLKDNLEYEGYRVFTEKDGFKGYQKALNKEVEFLLLDIMLPNMNGHEICKKVRKERPELPIIMITARGSEMDKVAGLDIGADDYVTKPFSIPELVARIRSVYRRVARINEVSDIFSFGNIVIDFKKLQAFKNDEEIQLSAREFKILQYFIQHEGEAVHRHDLLDEVWGFDVAPTTRTVDNFILDLRKKLEDNPSDPQHIIGVRSVGYRFRSLNH